MDPPVRKGHVKKIVSTVDNCPGFSEKRYQMICQIQKYLKEGCSYREIVRRMGIGQNTIAKYRKGDPKELSMYGIRQSKLDPFYDLINFSTFKSPHPDAVPGLFTHDSRSLNLTSTFVISGYFDSRHAIAPETTGVAIDVPVFIT